MNIFNLFKKQPPPVPRPPTPPRPVPTVVDDICSLNFANPSGLEAPLSPWQSNPEYVAQARRVISDPWYRRMVAYLRVTGYPTSALFNATTEERAAHQCRVEGYFMALNDLEILGTPRDVKTVHETYADSNAEEEISGPPEPQ